MTPWVCRWWRMFLFKITRKKTNIIIFSITQHYRDKYLFNVIKDYLVCGVMEKTSTRPNTISLIVSRLEDILNKIPYLLKNL